MKTKALLIVLLIALLSGTALADTNQTINVTSKSLVIAGDVTPLYYAEFTTNTSMLYVSGTSQSLPSTLVIYNNITENTLETVSQNNYVISKAY